MPPLSRWLDKNAADCHKGVMTARPPASDSNSRIVMLAYGPMVDGGHYWCYVAVKPSRETAFRKALSSGSYNLNQFAADGYGEIVVSGPGVTPPEAVTAKVAKMFAIPVERLFKEAPRAGH